ncbi:SRPBCC family protein [Peristeroidobacter agariperforans]|uniref:SRPBCC family protein n=1 Tax=Peristeroidobacter agariperforans TaxID=268404 RepID=UPI00101CF7D2|nr:SRPBCC family protein [Peristeroidobacter agariperforans]
MKQTDDWQLSVKRQFTASAERVFDAFLDPSKAGRFMFATATGTMVRVEIDARVGGAYAFVDRRVGEDVEHVGEYLEITRPRRLVFTLRVEKYSKDQSVVSIEITPRGSGCELVLTQSVSKQFVEHSQRIAAGWAAILDCAAEIVGP